MMLWDEKVWESLLQESMRAKKVMTTSLGTPLQLYWRLPEGGATKIESAREALLPVPKVWNTPE